LFVSDVVLPAAQCAKAIRDHWSIENLSHYIRDGSFAEDASRIRCNPGIFARLRSFAANILRFNGVRNVTDGRHRIAFGGIRAILTYNQVLRSTRHRTLNTLFLYFSF
jgi:hypothetical protein